MGLVTLQSIFGYMSDCTILLNMAETSTTTTAVLCFTEFIASIRQ
jgi:hypothetical protein